VALHVDNQQNKRETKQINKSWAVRKEQSTTQNKNEKNQPVGKQDQLKTGREHQGPI
jgi:hypothetical protein